MGTILCFDTETTGFRGDARILEIGLVAIEDGRITDSISRYFYPSDLDWAHPDVLGALKVNGLSERQLRGNGPIEHYLDFLDMELTHCDAWLGHNLSFDTRMLAQEFARAHQSMPSCKKGICTLEVARKYAWQTRRQGNKLEAVAADYHVDFEGRAHTALADAKVTAHIYLEMVKKGQAPSV